MLSESQLAMLRKESLVAISCNISSSPRFIDVAFLGCACCAEGHVGRHTQGLESVQALSNNPKLCLECLLQQPFNWHFVQENAGIEPHWLAWKVVGQIKERVVLPEVRNWHGKGSCCGKLTQCCQKASWQCFERRRWLPLAATSLLHHDTSMLLSLDVHVAHKVMWAGIHRDWRACRTLSNNRKNAGRLMLRRS